MPNFIARQTPLAAIGAATLTRHGGALGQGIRAAVGLKSLSALPQDSPSAQSTFSAAYFALSLMIGFIAGVLAGITIGLDTLLAIDVKNLKVLMGIAVAGYAGADFIENALSIVIPSSSVPPSGAAPTASAQDVKIETLTANTQALTNSVTALTSAVAALPAGTIAPTPLAAALHSVAPGVNTQIWAPALTSAFAKYDMMTNRRMAAAIGQFLVEAGANFHELQENMTYKSAARIAQVFPRVFKSEAEAEPYVNNPVALANKVYANYDGNGDEASGDGYRFHGGGLIQLTGRNEYASFGATAGMTAEEAAGAAQRRPAPHSRGAGIWSRKDAFPMPMLGTLTK